MLTTATLALVGGAAFGYYAPHARRYLVLPGLGRRLAASRTVVLTYDDGPSSALTPHLLDVLAARGARATFFMLGARALEFPALVDRVAAGGHEVACHGHEHVSAWATWPWRAVADIDAGYRALAPWVPEHGAFRPPHGRLSLATWFALRRRGAPVHWWTLDSGDTRAERPAPDSVAHEVARAGGGIVLLHDADRGPEHAQFVFAVTELVLQTAARRGLRVRTLSELKA